MDIMCATDVLKCRVFLVTLANHGRTWYQSLFMVTLWSLCIILKSPTDMLLVKQNRGKPLREYIRHFNIATMVTKNLSDEWAIQAFISGAEHEYLKYALTNEKPDKLHSLYEKANMYMEIV
ncbi:hypothetical protein V6Z12_D01G097100 [Gossypium hirsutum]